MSSDQQNTEISNQELKEEIRRDLYRYLFSFASAFGIFNLAAIGAAIGWLFVTVPDEVRSSVIDSTKAQLELELERVQGQATESSLDAIANAAKVIGRSEALQDQMSRVADAANKLEAEIASLKKNNTDATAVAEAAEILGGSDGLKNFKEVKDRITSLEGKLDEKIDAVQSAAITFSGYLSVNGSAGISAPQGTKTDDWDIILFPLALGMTVAETNSPMPSDLARYKPKAPSDGWVNEVEFWAYPSGGGDKWVVQGKQNLQNNTRKENHAIDVGYVLVRKNLLP